MGLLAAIASILNDATQSDGVVDLALSCIISYASNASVSQAALLVNAHIHTACMSVIGCYVDRDACKRIAAVQILCQLIDRGSESQSNLIKDGVVVTLVQSLQRPVDHPKIAAVVDAALKKISSTPDGKVALQSLDVRKAFALAFKQEYPQDYSSCYVWDHACSIAMLIYCDGINIGLKLSAEVVDVIRTCFGHLTKGLLEPRGPEKMARSADVLSRLGVVSDYADEITRQGGVLVCMDLMRVLQKLRLDYWQQNGFSNLLHTVYFMCSADTPTAAVARTEFIIVQGCDLLIQVLGDGTPGSRPVPIVYKVLVMLYALCRHADASVAVKQLPTASKESIKRSLTTHADCLKSQTWWAKNEVTAKLLQNLNATQLVSFNSAVAL